MLGTDIAPLSLKVTTNDKRRYSLGGGASECRHFADPPLDVSIAPVNWASNLFFITHDENWWGRVPTVPTVFYAPALGDAFSQW